MNINIRLLKVIMVMFMLQMWQVIGTSDAVQA